MSAKLLVTSSNDSLKTYFMLVISSFKLVFCSAKFSNLSVKSSTCLCEKLQHPYGLQSYVIDVFPCFFYIVGRGQARLHHDRLHYVL